MILFLFLRTYILQNYLATKFTIKIYNYNHYQLFSIFQMLSTVPDLKYIIPNKIDYVWLQCFPCPVFQVAWVHLTDGPDHISVPLLPSLTLYIFLQIFTIAWKRGPFQIESSSLIKATRYPLEIPI